MESDGAVCTLRLNGCLDTVTTQEFESAIASVPENLGRLVLDFSGVEFISSSALRTLVSAKKRMKETEIVIAGMNEVVKDVFEVTGLNEVFTIE